METDNKKIQIINSLAAAIGVEPEDIEDDDSFTIELHMNPAEFSDFIHSLSGSGYDISKLDMASIDTVNDLLEALGANSEI